MADRIIRFLAETGMRQEEVCGLEWSQVSIQRREIRLIKTKTSSPRVAPLSDIAIGTPRHATSPYVFWHAYGIRYTCFANNFARIARRAGVPFRCHDLRHAFASRFLLATGDIPALQAILGHRSIQMTLRCAHMLPAISTGRWPISAPRPAQKTAQWERYRQAQPTPTFSQVPEI
jgi:integrase